MGDDDSANKAVGQEEEGNTAPFPEKVFILFFFVILADLCFIFT